MTAENCKIQYEQAKERGDAAGMEYWKNRAAIKGLAVEEVETKSKRKK